MAVGFDLYVRLVGEAVAGFKGEGEQAPAEIKIELPVDANLPASYVARDDLLKLRVYIDANPFDTEAELIHQVR